MKLKTLFKGLDVTIKGNREVKITGISSHSQLIAPGNLFIAKKGKTVDGSAFIPKVIEIGAVAVFTDLYNPFLKEIVQVVSPHVNRLEPLLAKRYYRIEKTPLYLIGITGTNGKTTTSYLIHHFLSNFGLMGTIETIIGNHHFQRHLTTADVVTNHRTLREMADAGLKGAIMEVSSHALDQNRLEDIHFDLGIFTNLSQDHLDYHGTMDSYFKAKLKLFEKTDQHIYNSDDSRGKMIQGGMTFGIDKVADLQAKNIRISLLGTTFDLHYKGSVLRMKTSLIGKYNVYNILAALGAALQRGTNLATLQKHLATFAGVPGRLERIENPQGIHLFVDFAHTPVALANVLHTLSLIKTGKNHSHFWLWWRKRSR